MDYKGLEKETFCLLMEIESVKFILQKVMIQLLAMKRGHFYGIRTLVINSSKKNSNKSISQALGL